jgi:hypothetical protein
MEGKAKGQGKGPPAKGKPFVSKGKGKPKAKPAAKGKQNVHVDDGDWYWNDQTSLWEQWSQNFHGWDNWDGQWDPSWDNQWDPAWDHQPDVQATPDVHVPQAPPAAPVSVAPSTASAYVPSPAAVYTPQQAYNQWRGMPAPSVHSQGAYVRMSPPATLRQGIYRQLEQAQPPAETYEQVEYNKFLKSFDGPGDLYQDSLPTFFDAPSVRVVLPNKVEVPTGTFAAKQRKKKTRKIDKDGNRNVSKVLKGVEAKVDVKFKTPKEQSKWDISRMLML